MSRNALAFRTAALITVFTVQSVFGGEASISIVPIGTGPNGELAGGAVINGNAITLTTDGVNPVPIFLEIRIGDWDPHDIGVTLGGYQPAFDSSSLSTGAAGVLGFFIGASPCGECSDTGEPCTVVENCTAGTCSVSGDPCHVPTRFPIIFECPGNESCLGAATCDGGLSGIDICEVELGTGARCGPTGYFLGSGTCSFAYVDMSRPDFVLATAGSVLLALDVHSPDVRPGAAVVTGPPHAPVPFPAEGFYGATLALLVPPDAQGTFTISLKPFPTSTLLTGPGLKIEGACSGNGELCYTGGIECASVDDTCNGLSCTPSGDACRFDCPVGETCEGDVEMIPAQIRVNPGRCCFNLQLLPSDRVQCVNDLTENECADQNGLTFFEAGGTCNDDCPAVCGDNVNNRFFEECDGTDDAACPGACRDNCRCGVCGDGVQTGKEECDGADDAACPGECRDNCRCGVCGDDVQTGKEECDGADDEACAGICLGDCTCNPTCGDVDGDGNADMLGVAIFMNCFTGPGGGPATAACECAKYDADDDIDLDDYFGFFNTLPDP